MKLDIRTAYRAMLPKEIRQSVKLSRRLQNLAAYLSDKNVRTMAQRVRSLQGRYKGQRCFIMGSGPSLNKMDLEMFAQEYVWGVNKCYLLFDRISWRPSLYVAVDTRVVPDIALEIMHTVDSLPQTRFFFPVSFRKRKVLQSRDTIYWYRETPFDESNLPYSVFTQDASLWVSSVTTVTMAAMQLAVYLGFNPIYLIGCDTSYSVPPTVRFERGNSNKLISTQDDDESHFDPRYFGKGSKWHEPHVERMIFHYQQARPVCESLGVQVYNATVGGNLEVFPRVNYEELF